MDDRYLIKHFNEYLSPETANTLAIKCAGTTKFWNKYLNDVLAIGENIDMQAIITAADSSDNYDIYPVANTYLEKLLSANVPIPIILDNIESVATSVEDVDTLLNAGANADDIAKALWRYDNMKDDGHSKIIKDKLIAAGAKIDTDKLMEQPEDNTQDDQLFDDIARLGEF